ncbi:MAG: ATP-dependent helicase [Candidatus Omnitrophica bacterium]|nr:ATP-dependent helicase [Candidatus Omnitrophota bacterium]
MDLLEGLNPQQRKAVTHTQGPLLVIAGAGTGKTEIITKRVAYLITTKKASPSEILALTFTDKAANQMQERIDILVPYGFVDVWVSTFHSFGDKILRENALEIGLDPDFEILTQEQAVVFFREHLFSFPLKKYRPLGSPAKFIEVFLSIFNRARDEDVGPDEYIEYAQNLPETTPSEREEKERQKEIAFSYKKYMELQIQEGKLDFSSLVYLALKLLRECPSILKKYQENFKYILVDEFQDTNYSQLMLLKELAGSQRNIMVVCDDDQAIYRFRGAAFSNIINFMNFYPSAQKISININYRSQKAILDTAYRLVQHNNPDRLEIQAKIDKHLKPAQERQITPVKFCYFEHYSQEADFVSLTIKERVEKQGYKYRDFAILVRSNNDADPFLRSLNILGIPWRFSGNRGLFQQEEIRLCITFLKLIANPFDSLSLYYFIEKLYKINEIELLSLTNYASSKNQPLFSVLKNLEEVKDEISLSQSSVDKIEECLKDLENYIKIASTESTGRLLYLWLTEKGILSSFLREETLEAEQKIRNIAKFFESIREYEQLTREARLHYFVDYLDMIIEGGVSPEIEEAGLDVDAVNILTVHKAKGLEFRVVFIVGLVEGKFPWPKRSPSLELPKQLYKDILPSGDYHIQEERRLFYVALTRAREEVILTSSQDYGGKRLRKISRFVYEALDIPKIIPPLKREPQELIKIRGRKESPSRLILEKIPPDKVIPLSYYHIDDYLTCPLKYKFVHILRVPIIQHHSVIYGNALHQAIQRYNEAKKKGEKITLEEMIEVFLSSWRSEGFISREHEELRLKEGKDTLRKFYERQEREGKIPSEVEKEFHFSLDNLIIRGRWDRIDLEDGKPIIIDFKSSSVNTQEEADKKAKESLQMTLYAFSYYQCFGVLPERVELHFLESGLIGKAQKKKEDFPGLIEKIRKVEKGIRERDFTPQPTYLACQWCPYNQICPHTLINLFK